MQACSCATAAVLLIPPVPGTWSISLFPSNHSVGEILRVIVNHGPLLGDRNLSPSLLIYLRSLLIAYIYSWAEPEKPTGQGNPHLL